MTCVFPMDTLLTCFPPPPAPRVSITKGISYSNKLWSLKTAFGNAIFQKRL